MLEARRKGMLFMLLSLLCGIAAGFLFYAKVQSLNAQLGESVPVLVAKQPIQARTQLTSSMLETRELPRKFASDSMLMNPQEAKGKLLLVPLQAGDVITKSMLKHMTVSNSLRLVNLTQSERVMFDEQMDSTDRVDIVVSYQEGEHPVTKVLLEDIQVGKTGGEREGAKSIGVELSMDDAQKLIFMQNFARQIRVLKHTGSTAAGG